MPRDPIQCLWIGPRLGSMERICLASFLRHGHPVRLYAYRDVGNAPPGVEFAAAAEILPESAVFRSRDGSYANFADLFRYKLLADRGGWWADCDVACLRPWTGLPATVISSTDEQTHGRIPNVYVLRSPAGSPLMRDCYERALQLGEQKYVFAHTGPFLMNRVLGERGEGHLVVAPEVFGPVPWNSGGYLVVTRPFLLHWFHLKHLIRRPHLVPRFTRRTVGLHLWSNTWAPMGLDREARYSRRTLYGRLQRQFLPSA